VEKAEIHGFSDRSTTRRITKIYLLAAYCEPVFNVYAAFLSGIIKPTFGMLADNRSE
jgi:hypothetical protein